MADIIATGTLVEIHRVVLPGGKRAPQVPDDTGPIALEMCVKGYLLAPAALGEEAEIVTPVGRKLRGIIEGSNPAYSHGFGVPIAELSAIGREIRALLHQRRQVS